MNDLVNRLGATLLQVLLALGTVTWAPVLIPGVPPWLCWLAGVLVALVGVVVHVTGVNSSAALKIKQVAGTVASTVELTAAGVNQVYANSNLAAPPVIMTDPGHAEAQAAASTRAVVPGPLVNVADVGGPVS